MIIYSRGLILS